MARRFIYPVDSASFQDIRERGKLYVDKTDMVFSLVNEYKYVFLSRPRRFGKSLLCSTFKAYFQGQKELFEGLKMMAQEKDWTVYPVLHFSMSGLKNQTVEEAKSRLCNFIADYEKTYGRVEEELTPGARFCGLIHRACEQTGRKVVVLIDEYDAPIMRLLYNRPQLDAMRNMLREFYQVLKDEEEYLRFVFLTGITKFSQLSIFSELNNLMNISMLPEYSGLCGITQTELDTVMRPCVEEFSEDYGCSVDEAYALLRKQYDGYRFCRNSEEVYAPFSLLRALNDRDINDYWFTGATPSTLLEHLNHFPLATTIDYDGVEVDIDQFQVPCEDSDTPMPLLYQSGYLSIASYDAPSRQYTLHFPNNEVRNGMVKCLMPLLLKRSMADNNNLIVSLFRSIQKNDLPATLSHLRAYIVGIPYDVMSKEDWEDRGRYEKFYQILMYLVFTNFNALVNCEVKIILGRADIVIETKTDVYVIELKVNDTVDAALKQIEDKGYAIPWTASGRRVTKCGIRLDPKQRNISHWRIVDEQNRVIDEQKF